MVLKSRSGCNQIFRLPLLRKNALESKQPDWFYEKDLL